MTTDQRLIAWSTAWALIDGVVLCASCRCIQPVSQSDELFAHEQSCMAERAAGSSPWIELHDILDTARG